MRRQLHVRRIPQKSYAAHLGVSQAGVSARLRGIQPFRLDEIERTARLLGVPWVDLLAELPEDTPVGLDDANDPAGLDETAN